MEMNMDMMDTNMDMMDTNIDMIDTNIDMIDNMNCHYESYYDKISINELFDSES